jgi:hypothetical protein
MAYHHEDRGTSRIGMWLAGVAIAVVLLGGWYGVSRYQDLVNSIKPEVVEVTPVVPVEPAPPTLDHDCTAGGCDEPPDTNPVVPPPPGPPVVVEPAPCPPWDCNPTPVPVPYHGHRWHHRHHWHGYHHHFHRGGASSDDLPFMPPFPR